MDMAFDFQERVVFDLRSLYNRYGYSQYRMSKFEEYDLYARNKDFLISDSVITFTDLDGKLMALKPDVTLSIVKNTKDLPDTQQKLYYNENIYRVTKGTHGYREIMQLGLECLGNIDEYCICEVLTLAAESLRCISGESVLVISHLGLLLEILDEIGVAKDVRALFLKAIGEKNLHELTALCEQCVIREEKAQLLKQLVSTKGKLSQVLRSIQALLPECAQTLPPLLRIASVLESSPVGEMLRFDLSVVDDMHYYNGFVFKGFIAGLPSSVLSGGQYDKLMQKLQKRSCAIGFAVYMDALERLDRQGKEWDVDTVLLYEDGQELSVLRQQADLLRQSGSSVMVLRKLPENLRCRQLCRMTGSEVTVIENDA